MEEAFSVIDGQSVEEETNEETKATLRINGKNIDLQEAQTALDALDEYESQNAQLCLFEGYQVDMIEVTLKTMKSGARPMTEGERTPRLFDNKYYLVKARVLGVNHTSKEGVLTKTVSLEAVKQMEIDELSAERYFGQ